MGLGLSITHRIIDQHDGKIEVSAPGKGNSFYGLAPCFMRGKDADHSDRR
jgi:nitrogen-specific signal transduction histidine kinase